MLYYINLLVAFACTFILIFTAGFVLYKNRGGQSPVYYAQYNLAGAGIMGFIFLTYYAHDSQYALQFNRLSQVATIIFSGTLLNLSLTYPEREKKVPFYIPLACMAPAIIISLLVFFTDYSISSVKFVNMRPDRTIGFLYPVYAAASFLYFLVFMGIFFYKYIKVKNETFRLQIRYVVFATSIFITFTYIGSIFMPLLYNNYTLYVLAPTLTSLAATGTLLYSVLAYNLMDIRTALLKAAVYLLLTAVFFSPILVLIYLFDVRLASLNIPSEVKIISAVAFFMIISFILQPRIERTYRRNIFDIDDLTNRYIRKASTLKTLDELIDLSVRDLCKGLSLNRGLFFMYNDTERIFKKIYDSRDEFHPDEDIERHFPLIKWFARNQGILPENRIYIDEEYFGPIRTGVSEFFDRYGIGSILPVYYENRIFGMLCLGKRDNGKNLTPDEIEHLEEFRIRFNDFIITVLAFDKAKKDQFITRSLELSADILSSAAARVLPNIKNIKFSSLIAPRYQRGFDYFDYIQPTENTLGLLCTDVSGIGVNNALYAVILRSVFHSCINEAASPYIIIKRINLVINEYTKGGGELVTAFYAFFDSNSRRVYYANAGFPPMEVFRIDKNDFDSLDTEGSPLGYDPLSEYGQGTSELKAGDICAIYSKSLINSKNSEGESFGLLRLRNTIREQKSRTPSEIVKNLKAAYEKFMGIALPDSDITVIVMKIV
ncbi:MAG TPA: SpoIIE family protein phosphatase [Spirochaetota bacterium]|nr:SpoIIE family protein phosphatase [Spirochaetota bacterium]HPF06847.1 SpoIIE family protein phosphatase [Spirochaetota bacterium]HPJ42186.1 SpoIIE family protein phosphatase [Spirochaetota bacterium]HPR39100.1 SpoIIE family protein phosphatase [Spirochaetota bacterium]HRX48039.1 SpoIIE family protein phosphatase [Spirochaetota bacterium]